MDHRVELMLEFLESEVFVRDITAILRDKQQSLLKALCASEVNGDRNRGFIEGLEYAISLRKRVKGE